MRLTKIKLAGFKSFVDPTTVHFPSDLTGVIGPNGCGKSNVIDAVRWVMGESSAKHLRGDSMADVIFNGSSSRKPVGTASIELVFDNSDGSVGGQYAQFNEISVKRQVSRDGQSSYFLNSARCRRRDITDIFLGTGLGPRSYAIIEQGMISRLIEARPEELRVYLEEAAGISKYKERRRETENRIRHTRENLERLTDLRDEVDKQLNHLQRQARTAERYKELKGEERHYRAQLLALKARNLDEKLDRKDREIAERENRMQEAVAEQRSVESDIEKGRDRLTEANDHFNEIQGRYYSLGAEIARLEQSIQHGRDLRRRQERDLEQAEHNRREIQGHIDRDREHLEELTRTLEEMEPGLERAREAEKVSGEALAGAEASMSAWQSEWEQFSRDASDTSRSAEVERTRIQHLESQMQRALSRLEKLREEQQRLSTEAVEREIGELRAEVERLESQRDQSQGQLDELLDSLGVAREEEKAVTAELHDLRSGLEDGRGRLSSLEALQQAALGKEGGELETWLERQGLADRPRLAQRVRVASGWERALETVLGYHLQGVCVDELDGLHEAVGALEGASVTLFETGEATDNSGDDPERLASKVETDVPLGGLLDGVFTADDLNGALAARSRLSGGQSIVTRDGLWIGPNWVRINREQDEQAGVLEREREIEALRAQVDEMKARNEGLAEQQERLRERVREMERRREELQVEVNRAHRQRADAAARLETRTSRLDQMKRRHEQVSGEIADLEEQVAELEEGLKNARGELEKAMASMESGERERTELEARRDELRRQLDEAHEQARADRDATHELALKVESRRSVRDSTEKNLARMREQLEQLDSRTRELREYLERDEDPVADQEKELNETLEKRQEVERRLQEARGQLEEIEEEMRALDRARGEKEKRAAELREDLEKLRLNSQETRVRRETIGEQLEETGEELETLLETMPEEAEIGEWERQVQSLSQKIQRLGPINLAAIDEYEEMKERKAYLDKQDDDLMDALNTLESAIQKIDRETRTRFKETFDKVNSELQKTFPRLFGGGHAYLEMTGDDLLSAGVEIMARPPGKRNSTIQLLSGGEKALTAVALVFAIFELNPAPFCMLDEVDAPLDDANVGRFCELVKEMSERVQFILITHNKTTMELANHLTGVTMNEPGVSRLVSVDVEEAVEMAAI